MRSERKGLAVAVTVALALVGHACGTRNAVVHPTFPVGGLVATGAPLASGALRRLDGMYVVRSGTAIFGSSVAIHATRETLSLFTDQNAAYAILRGACLESGTKLVLEGAWRFPDSEKTGLARLFVGPEAVAKSLCANESGALPSPPTFDGTTGDGIVLPTSAAALAFDHAPKPTAGRFVVVGHHGACATVDDCGASENSLESIRMSASFGASIVELDVQTSADGVPFLFHDTYLSARLTEGQYCHGPVYGMTFANIRANCKLKFGETIPSLDEALDAVLADPDLRGVWLDLKGATAVAPAMAQIAKHGGSAPHGTHGVHVVVGLADTESVTAYTALPPPPGSLCLVELSPDDTRHAGCQIWGPSWTSGPDPADVAALQAEGRAVTFWTVDEQAFIDQYLRSAPINGIVTNRPGLVFHRYQMLGTLPPDRAQL